MSKHLYQEGAEAKGPLSRLRRALHAFAAFTERHPVLRYTGCFLFPLLLLYATHALVGMHPFGENSVLVLDLGSQYVFFFEALRDWVFGEGSLLYSFSRSLGGEFMGMYAYYIASPLSYIVALFPKSMIQEALLTIFLLKCGISALTAAIYLRKSAKVSWSAAFLFSTMYAMCGYAVTMHHNTMWMDCFALLPLLSLAIERLITEGKYKLLVITLTVMLMSNYYIGYMVCIYCVIYFFFAYFRMTEEERNPQGLSRHFLRRLTRMGIFSLMALMMAMLIILPAYYSLSFGKNVFSTPIWSFDSRFSLYDLFCKFLFGSYDTVRPVGIPNVYCGVAVLLLVPLFFINRGVSKREKLCSAAIITIFVLSFSLNFLDLIWHGFQKPNWLNYRYAFMLVFLLLTMAAKAFDRLKSTRPSAIILVGGAVLALTLAAPAVDALRTTPFFESFATIFEKPDTLSPWLKKFAASLPSQLKEISVWLMVGISLLLILIYTLLCLLRSGKSKRAAKVASGVMAGVLMVECLAGGVFHLASLDKDVNINNYQDYKNYLDRWQGEVDYTKNTDSGFFRTERLDYRKRNDSFGLGYYGLGGSTSTVNTDTINFLAMMGYRAASHWSSYGGINPVSDSLLGVKYVLGTTKDAYMFPPTYTQYHKSDDVVSYKNALALPIAYVVDDDIERLTLTKRMPADIGGLATDLSSSLFGMPFATLAAMRTELIPTYEDHFSPFERLNRLVSAMLGEDVQLFYPVHVETTTENITVATNYVTNIRYTIADDSVARNFIHFTVHGTAEEDSIFCYFPSPTANRAELYINGSFKRAYFTENTFGTVYVGNPGEGKTVKVSLNIDKRKNSSKYINISKVPGADVPVDCFYALDADLYEEVFTRLAAGGYQVSEATGDTFDGSITTHESNATVLTTIPYDKGWVVEVDGEEVATYETLDALLTFRVEQAGEHQLTLRYRPTEYKLALLLFVMGFVLFNGYMLAELICKRIKKKKNAPLPAKDAVECPPHNEENIS